MVAAARVVVGGAGGGVGGAVVGGRPKLVLIGLPGAGKSSVGRELEHLGFGEFLDLDAAVEAAAGRTITELVRVEGEQRFRDVETHVLREVLNQENAQRERCRQGAVDAANEGEGEFNAPTVREYGIVALGGGTLGRVENRNQIRECSVVIYLKVDPALAAERVVKDERTKHSVSNEPLGTAAETAVDELVREVRRPILFLDERIDDAGLTSRTTRRIAQLLTERGPLYEEAATFVIRTNGAKPAAIAACIARALTSHGWSGPDVRTDEGASEETSNSLSESEPSVERFSGSVGLLGKRSSE